MIKEAISYEQYLHSFQTLSSFFKQILRVTAAEQLRAEGFEEVGSSDVSNRVYEMFHEFGSFSEVLRAIANNDI